MKHLNVATLVIALCFASLAIGQKRSDADLFNEARIAIDKFKDCPAAVKALNEVSAQGKRNPIWIYYKARASECANDLAESLSQYREYNRIAPGHQEILDKIGELEYKLRKQQEDNAAAQQQRLDLARHEETAKTGLMQQLNQFAGTWEQQGNVSPVYFHSYCSARRHEERTLSIDNFNPGELVTIGHYQIELTVKADSDNPTSDCDRWDDINMRRDEWEQERTYDLKLTCNKEDNSSCSGELTQTGCSGSGCDRSENFLSITVRRVGPQLSLVTRSGTYLMRR